MLSMGLINIVAYPAGKVIHRITDTNGYVVVILSSDFTTTGTAADGPNLLQILCDSERNPGGIYSAVEFYPVDNAAASIGLIATGGNDNTGGYMQLRNPANVVLGNLTGFACYSGLGLVPLIVLPFSISQICSAAIEAARSIHL